VLQLTVLAGRTKTAFVRYSRASGRFTSHSGGSTGFWLRGSMPPCRLRRRKFCKFDYETVHFGVYLNKYTVSVAPFSTPACPDCSQNIYKTAFFACFRFLIFIHFFQGGQLTPFARGRHLCGRPWSDSNARDAMLTRILAITLCQSVSLSQVGVQSKRLNESGWFLAQELPLTCTKLCH